MRVWVCLVGGEIRRIKNRKEKTDFMCVLLERMRGWKIARDK